ncbi:CTLH/CRA C-terminal to lish motif domain-containing protein [Fimicolochytrium jonesii]|uniref:CTLH/CRA C-terminal to lish motif domain-containing protein n=1 Tax=Fimicolochytrium jonesii TaxID=1396493 RepID=UPI0022FDF7BE|nr:CTLH/CRA C-terminal to lish motif domain-containing protein [Fimicolochytrium jonesii]KAI8815773.1 CTLH/CRA C-terminal to lish motif domain-containing protein [Fimicolochytrium jonesii]
MEKGKVNHDGLFNIEQPLLKVPAEQLKKAARTTQRYIDYFMKEINADVTKLGKNAGGSVDASQAVKTLDEMVERLVKLKRKIAETKAEEFTSVERTKTRLNHLTDVMSVTSSESPAFNRWCQTRMERLLVDYMLRNGYSRTAQAIASELKIGDLVDIELFAESGQVEEALRNQNCAECLKWCADNRSSLEKIQSTLEFNLRFQEYIELVRAQKKEEAIKYCRKYLITWQAAHMSEIQQAMALLAFSPDTWCEPYKDLYSPHRWTSLIDQFRSSNHALHNLTSQPLLTMTLQAGLSALKTPACYNDDDRTINCPVCSADTFGRLAEDLPNAHHVNSCLVDRVTGGLMGEDNLPLVLPNGFVYSTKSLAEAALQNNGMVRCIKTGDQYHISTARKAFLL